MDCTFAAAHGCRTHDVIRSSNATAGLLALPWREETENEQMQHSVSCPQVENRNSHLESESEMLDSKENFQMTKCYVQRFLRDLKEIGSTGFGNYYLCQDTHSKRMIVKKVHSSTNTDSMIAYEYMAMESLSGGKHFLDFYGFHNFKPATSLLYMEYFPSVTLDTYFGQHQVPPCLLRNLLHQVAQGLQCMHRAFIVHRNLTGENIMVNHKNRIKITEFGLSKRHRFHEGFAGEIGYAAPEVVAYLFKKKPVRYGYACDMYSFGCIIYKKLFGRLPGYSSTYVLDTVVGCEEYQSFLDSGIPVEENGVYFPEGLDPLLEDLLKGLLNPDQKCRLNAWEAVNHPYFTNFPEDLKESEDDEEALPLIQELAEIDEEAQEQEEAQKEAQEEVQIEAQEEAQQEEQEEAQIEAQEEAQIEAQEEISLPYGGPEVILQAPETEAQTEAAFVQCQTNQRDCHPPTEPPESKELNLLCSMPGELSGKLKRKRGWHILPKRFRRKKSMKNVEQESAGNNSHPDQPSTTGHNGKTDKSECLCFKRFKLFRKKKPAQSCKEKTETKIDQEHSFPPEFNEVEINKDQNALCEDKNENNVDQEHYLPTKINKDQSVLPNLNETDIVEEQSDPLKNSKKSKFCRFLDRIFHRKQNK